MKEKRIKLTKEQIGEIKRILKKEDNFYTKEEINRLIALHKNKKVIK